MRQRLCIKTVSELAEKLGVSEGLLWRLAGNVDRHYRCWEQPKKNNPGEKRRISAPIGDLRKIQKKLHVLLNNTCDFGPYSHYGRKKRSNVTNALVHVAGKIVFTCDLEGFFPSVRPERVKESLVLEQECSDEVAKLITRLVTHQFQLPQGAATSTDIANIVTFRMQRRLGALARQWGLKFTILGDDITFSGNVIPTDFVRRAKDVIASEGFKVHTSKGGVFTKSERQMVTGINVAHGLSVRKEKLYWEAEYRQQRKNRDEGEVDETASDAAQKKYNGRMSYANSVRKRNLIRPR